jgi:hypothetical protein
MEGMNLFKVYCMHMWNYHSEISLIINIWQFKNKIKNEQSFYFNPFFLLIGLENPIMDFP